jgi:hypothetical protein
MTEDNKTDRVISMDEFEEATITPKLILEKAIEAGLSEVIICGSKDGKVYISSSCENMMHATFFAEIFKNVVLNGYE